MDSSGNLDPVDMNSISPTKDVTMDKDVLKTFLDSVDRLGREATEASVRSSIVAARVAWASIYDMILLAGGVHPENLSAFAATLDQCAHIIGRVKTQDAPAYQRQIEWYRKLITLYDTRGVQGVNQAIEDAFVAADKSKSLPMTFLATGRGMQVQPG